MDIPTSVKLSHTFCARRTSLKPTVFIHTNEKQMLGALVSRYSLRKRSAHADKFDVKFVEVKNYPCMLEREEQTVAGQEITELKLVLDLDADVTEFTIPDGLVGAGYAVKNEILVKSEEGNQSATEFCWTGN